MGTVLMRTLSRTDDSPKASTPRTSSGSRIFGPCTGSVRNWFATESQDVLDGLDVFLVRNVDVEHRVRVVLRHVGELVDHAVRDHVHRPVLAAQRDRPQTNGLHQTRLAIDRDDVPEANLIFQNQKEPRDDVTNEILRAKADGEAGDAGAGQNRTMSTLNSESAINVATPRTSSVATTRNS